MALSQELFGSVPPYHFLHVHTWDAEMKGLEARGWLVTQSYSAARLPFYFIVGPYWPVYTQEVASLLS